MSEITDGPDVLLEWTRNKCEVGRLTVEEFNGKKFIHMRIWYRDESGTLQPTKRGVTIPVGQLATIRMALRKLEKVLADSNPVAGQAIKRKNNWGRK